MCDLGEEMNKKKGELWKEKVESEECEGMKSSEEREVIYVKGRRRRKVGIDRRKSGFG